MKAATLTLLVMMVGWCKKKYYLIETRDGSDIRSHTFNTEDTEYGNNYNDYYTDYQGICLAFMTHICRVAKNKRWHPGI